MAGCGEGTLGWWGVCASYEWGGVGLDGEDEIFLVACALFSICLSVDSWTGFLAGRLTHVVSYAAPCSDLLVSD